VRIGLDLDNTLIDYGPAFPIVAASLGIDGPTDRISLRERLHEVDEDLWQLLQSRLYTGGLAHAVPSEGSLEFLRTAQQRGAHVVIISHKTANAQPRFGGEALHPPALQWLRDHDIVPKFVRDTNVRFCATRGEKLKAIRSERLDWFIDDLMEILENPLFPASTTGWWFAAHRDHNLESQTPESVDFTGLLMRLEQW